MSGKPKATKELALSGEVGLAKVRTAIENKKLTPVLYPTYYPVVQTNSELCKCQALACA